MHQLGCSLPGRRCQRLGLSFRLKRCFWFADSGDLDRHAHWRPSGRASPPRDANISVRSCAPVVVAGGDVRSCVRTALWICVEIKISGRFGNRFSGSVHSRRLWRLLRRRARTDDDSLEPALRHRHESHESVKDLLVSAANTVAVLCFILASAVRWHSALFVGADALLGGFFGAQVGKKLPSVLVKSFTIAIAAGMTIYFFLKAY